MFLALRKKLNYVWGLEAIDISKCTCGYMRNGNRDKPPQNLIYLYGSSYFFANSATFSGGQPGTSIPSDNPIASN